MILCAGRGASSVDGLGSCFPISGPVSFVAGWQHVMTPLKGQGWWLLAQQPDQGGGWWCYRQGNEGLVSKHPRTWSLDWSGLDHVGRNS